MNGRTHPITYVFAACLTFWGVTGTAVWWWLR